MHVVRNLLNKPSSDFQRHSLHEKNFLLKSWNHFQLYLSSCKPSYSPLRGTSQFQSCFGNGSLLRRLAWQEQLAKRRGGRRQAGVPARPLLPTRRARSHPDRHNSLQQQQQWGLSPAGSSIWQHKCQIGRSVYAGPSKWRFSSAATLPAQALSTRWFHIRSFEYFKEPRANLRLENFPK